MHIPDTMGENMYNHLKVNSLKSYGLFANYVL